MCRERKREGGKGDMGRITREKGRWFAKGKRKRVV